MSSPSTTFRLFYPATNTLTAVSLFDATGAALTPQTLANGADNPVGFQSKVLTFTAASEPLFATPTFSDPNSPVSLYLCRDDAGAFQKVLDETVFNPAEPGRPTPAVTSAQVHGHGSRRWPQNLHGQSASGRCQERCRIFSFDVVWVSAFADGRIYPG